jgi:alkaline ceramidase TOD1/glycosyltransferase MUCI70-like protein
LTGRYEKLNEQHVAARSRIPFLCLTDDPDLRSESWEVRLVSPIFAMDHVRSHRDIKIRPHYYLPEFAASFYIDNSVLLREPPERLFDLFERSSGFCLPHHSFRDTVLAEFLEVVKLGYDDLSRVREQLNHYRVECPQVLQEKPYWGAMLLRDHSSAAVRAMLEGWAAHVQRYSRRDQLSINFAFRRAGLMPQVLRIDNFSSVYHSWPHTPGRSQNGGTQQAADSSSQPAHRIHKLGQALAELIERNEALERALAEEATLHSAVLAAATWRAMGPVRHFARRYPAVGQFLRRGLNLLRFGGPFSG